MLTIIVNLLKIKMMSLSLFPQRIKVINLSKCITFYRHIALVMKLYRIRLRRESVRICKSVLLNQSGGYSKGIIELNQCRSQ